MKRPNLDDYRKDDDFPRKFIRDMEIYKEEITQQLIDEVIDNLKEQILVGDFTVLEELLGFIPTENLIQSLPEEDWDKYIEIKE